MLQISGIRVRETIPYWVVQQADEVVMIDLTPRALLHRLERGVVYGREKVEKALQEAAGKARAKGRAVGSYARDIEMGKWLKDLGVQYLAVNVDATIYLQACEGLAKALK